MFYLPTGGPSVKSGVDTLWHRGKTEKGQSPEYILKSDEHLVTVISDGRTKLRVEIVPRLERNTVSHICSKYTFFRGAVVDAEKDPADPDTDTVAKDLEKIKLGTGGTDIIAVKTYIISDDL